MTFVDNDDDDERRLVIVANRFTSFLNDNNTRRMPYAMRLPELVTLDRNILS